MLFGNTIRTAPAPRRQADALFTQDIVRRSAKASSIPNYQNTLTQSRTHTHTHHLHQVLLRRNLPGYHKIAAARRNHPVRSNSRHRDSR